MMSVQKLLGLGRKPHSKNFWWLCNDWMWFRRLDLIGVVHSFLTYFAVEQRQLFHWRKVWIGNFYKKNVDESTFVWHLLQSRRNC